MNYDDTLEIIRKATAAGVIKWNLDFPRGRQPIIVPGIETHFFHFKATIGEFDLYFSPQWEHGGRYSYDEPGVGSLLVFELEVVDRHGENVISSDPYSRFAIEPERFDLLYLYLVTVWNCLRHTRINLFEEMYGPDARNANTFDFVPIDWDIAELVGFCA